MGLNPFELDNGEESKALLLSCLRPTEFTKQWRQNHQGSSMVLLSLPYIFLSSTFFSLLHRDDIGNENGLWGSLHNFTGSMTLTVGHGISCFNFLH